MALLNFHYGLKEQLPSQITNGNLYITTDSQGLYVDLEGSRIHVSDFIQVADTTALTALGTYNRDVFYYVVASNALLKYTGIEGSEWKQLNSTADLSDALSKLTTRVSTAETNITNLQSADAELESRIDGINASTVDTTTKIKVTTAVGNYAKGAEIDANTDLQTLILNMLCKDSNPKKTDPSLSVTLAEAGAKEVGTKVTPTFTTSFSAGKYTANSVDQASGVTATAYSVTDSNGNEVTASSGSYPEITVVETDATAGTTATNYKLTAVVTHTEGNMPKTYLGNDYPSVRIAAGTKSATSSAITGFRSYFWGYKKDGSTLDINALTSEQIRALGNPNSAGTNQNIASTAVPETITTNKMKQMFFAFPKGVKSSVAVANNVNGAPQTVTKRETTVMVAGANGYRPVEYDVFYISNAAAESGDTTFKITIA